jgi:hypothetical protein
MINYNFAVFILSHGRANNVVTLKTLKRVNYSGKIYIVCDDEDDQLEDYKKLSGVTDVLVFSKQWQMDHCDRMDNFNTRKVILYARNACFDFAEQLGLDYFVEFDDDYSAIEMRYVQNFALKTHEIKDFDSVINSFLKFYADSKIKSIAFAQGGDLLGGAESQCFRKGFKRKAMNSFFCRTKDRCYFTGSINEDVNMYVSGGIRGDIYLTIANVSLVQGQTQSNKGGMTEQYLESGTYVKSFYSVMIAPSCVKVKMMASNHQRLHHSISWNNCTPCIISDKYKKI